jgi:hypothetical protein
VGECSAKKTSLDGGAVPRPPARSVEDGRWGNLRCGIIVVLSDLISLNGRDSVRTETDNAILNDSTAGDTK